MKGTKRGTIQESGRHGAAWHSAALTQNDRFLRSAYHAALVPCMLSILGGCLNIIADGILVGQRIGTDGLAAINLCLPVYLVLCVAGSFAVSGGAISCAAEIGAGHREGAQRFYGETWYLCILASALLTLWGIFGSGLTAHLVCRDPALYAMVLAYTRVTLLGSAPKILIYIPFWYLRLQGKNRTVTVMMAVMGIGNILLDILFLFGFDMGVFGAGLASVIATGAAALLGIVALHTGEAPWRLLPVRPTREDTGRIASAGSPAAMNNLCQTFRSFGINSLLLLSGGPSAVAVFGVLSGVSAYTDAVTLGTSQAGQAMLGVSAGEKDTGSIRILLRMETRTGVFWSGVTGIALVALSGVIRRLYGLETALTAPLFSLAVSLIPSCLLNILLAWYNVGGHTKFANVLIALRVLLLPVGILWCISSAGGYPWVFIPAAEILTLCIWYPVSGVISRKNPDLSRHLLLDERIEKSGQVIGFSSGDGEEEICSASERITDFCRANGMDTKKSLRIELSLEELLTVIAQENRRAADGKSAAQGHVRFDLRVFSLQGVTGIRIRYDGVRFDPVTAAREEDGDAAGRYMGVQMILRLVEHVDYQNVYGMNSLMVLL